MKSKTILPALLICALAAAAFCACLTGCSDGVSETTTHQTDETSSSENEPEPSEEGMYDTTAVANAYISGDTSGLSEYDLAIYNAAAEALNTFYTDGMSAYDAVLAAHDYVVTHVTYDLGELALIGSRAEESDSPYGALIDGKAICSGYTTTFKLFMDMIGVECITVDGSALDEVHAWNMVNIDGKWYHVDCTWDDYTPDYEGRPAAHIYFLVTDEVMRREHVWDEDTTPSADSDDLNYYVNNGLYVTSVSQASEIIAREVAHHATEVELMLNKELNAGGIPLSYPEGVGGYSYWLNEFESYNVVIYHVLWE